MKGSLVGLRRGDRWAGGRRSWGQEGQRGIESIIGVARSKPQWHSPFAQEGACHAGCISVWRQGPRANEVCRGEILRPPFIELRASAALLSTWRLARPHQARPDWVVGVRPWSAFISSHANDRFNASLTLLPSW